LSTYPAIVQKSEARATTLIGVLNSVNGDEGQGECFVWKLKRGCRTHGFSKDVLLRTTIYCQMKCCYTVKHFFFARFEANPQWRAMPERRAAECQCMEAEILLIFVSLKTIKKNIGLVFMPKNLARTQQQ
jgi:hypothetical protein